MVQSAALAPPTFSIILWVEDALIGVQAHLSFKALLILDSKGILCSYAANAWNFLGMNSSVSSIMQGGLADKACKSLYSIVTQFMFKWRPIIQKCCATKPSKRWMWVHLKQRTLLEVVLVMPNPAEMDLEETTWFCTADIQWKVPKCSNVVLKVFPPLCKLVWCERLCM